MSRISSVCLGSALLHKRQTVCHAVGLAGVSACCVPRMLRAQDGFTFRGREGGVGKGPGKEVRRAWGRSGDSACLVLDQKSKGRL